jgi:hypothetical protein
MASQRQMDFMPGQYNMGTSMDEVTTTERENNMLSIRKDRSMIMRTSIQSTPVCVPSNSIDKIQGCQNRPIDNVIRGIEQFASILTANHAVIVISLRLLRITSIK